MVSAIKINGIRKGSVMFLKTCQLLQPSTLAASIGSLGMPNNPAKSKIANIDFRLDTVRLKNDIQKRTRVFMKKGK